MQERHKKHVESITESLRDIEKMLKTPSKTKASISNISLYEKELKMQIKKEEDIINEKITKAKEKLQQIVYIPRKRQTESSYFLENVVKSIRKSKKDENNNNNQKIILKKRIEELEEENRSLKNQIESIQTDLSLARILYKTSNKLID